MNIFKKLFLRLGFPKNKYNPYAWIVGDPKIGESCWIGPFTIVDGSGGLTIGKNTTISGGAHIYTHSAVRRNISEREYSKVDRKSVEIGNFVHIGANATVFMGSKIGHHTIIGAGAVVLESTEIPPYSVVVGIPAKTIKKVSRDFIPKHLLKDYDSY